LDTVGKKEGTAGRPLFWDKIITDQQQ